MSTATLSPDERERIAAAYGAARVPAEVTKVPRGQTGLTSEEYIWDGKGLALKECQTRAEKLAAAKRSMWARHGSDLVATRREGVRRMAGEGMTAAEVAKALGVAVHILRGDAQKGGFSFAPMRVPAKREVGA